jgi:hypothetical protein
VSLVLDGATQYGYSPIGSWQTARHPFTMACWFKPAASAAGPLMQVSRADSNTQWVELGRHNNGVRGAIRASDYMIGGALVADDWNSIVVDFESDTVRHVHLNGVTVANGDGNPYQFPELFSFGQYVIGANLNSGGFGPNVPGKICHAATYIRPFTEGNAAEWHAGANPQSFTGLLSYHVLLNDALDIHGTLDLTLVGAPSFDTVDHKAVDAWPPAAGGGVIRQASLSGGFNG